MTASGKNIVLGVAIVILIAAMIFFLSNKQTNSPVSEMKTEVSDSSAIMELSKTIDEINLKLDSIREQKSALMSDLRKYPEISSKREKIMNNIFLLANLINRSETQIEKLNKALSHSESKNHLLQQKLIAYESGREDMIRELENVKYELELSGKLNTRLSTTLDHQKKNTARTLAKLNATENIAFTAYYIAGDHSLLKRLNLLDVRGKDIPVQEFEKVDTRAEAIIPTHAKNVKVLTSHAKGSYNWQDDDQGNKNLCIVEPLLFWKNSRYLIIEVN